MIEVHPEDRKVLEEIEAAIGIEFEQVEDFDSLDWQKGSYHCNKQGRVIALGLDQCGLEALPSLSGLSFLQVLQAIENQIQDITPLQHLSSLTTLYLSSNQIQDIAPLKRLSYLTTLNLYTNQIQDITPLQALKILQKLQVAGNEIKRLPPALCRHFPIISEYWLDDEAFMAVGKNPLESPPMEIVDQGKDAVLSYLTALEAGASRPLGEVKVLLIGDGAAGKTSLVQRLCHNTFDPEQNQTEGIRVEPWSYEHGTSQITTKLWDFGGQEIMHATHRIFLSQRSLYILVQDARADGMDNTRYWLNHVQNYGGNAPVLIVINKIDQNPAYELDENQLKRDYPNIRDFYRLSCASGDGIPPFREVVQEALPNLRIARIVWPESWLGVKQELSDLEEPFIPAEQYTDLCESRHIRDQQVQEVLLRFLHDLGVTLSFDDFELKHTQVLNPAWATNGIYRIINEKSLAQRNGVLPKACLGEILPRDLYPTRTHDFLLQLMRKFELCYPLPQDDPNPGFIVPNLLSQNSPADFGLGEDQLRVIYRYDFLQPSIFLRLMVRLYRDITENWRQGMILEGRQCRAVILERPEDREIQVTISGPGRRDYFQVIRLFLAQIHQSFTSLSVDLLVLPEGRTDSRHAFRYETILKAFKEKVEDLPDMDLNRFFVVALLEQVESVTEAEGIAANAVTVAEDVKHHESENDKSLWETVKEATSWKVGALGFSIDMKPILAKIDAVWQGKKKDSE